MLLLGHSVPDTWILPACDSSPRKVLGTACCHLTCFVSWATRELRATTRALKCTFFSRDSRSVADCALASATASSTRFCMACCTAATSPCRRGSGHSEPTPKESYRATTSTAHVQHDKMMNVTVPMLGHLLQSLLHRHLRLCCVQCPAAATSITAVMQQPQFKAEDVA